MIKMACDRMIDFILVENSKGFANLNKNIIDKILIKTTYVYQIKEWEAERNGSFKIYILEYNKKGDNSYKIMKKIRESNDWSSLFVVITKNKEKAFELYYKRLMILEIIEQDTNYEQNLTNILKIAIRNYETRPKTLKYTYKNITYNIPLNQIIYIEKLKDNKKCLIRTLNENNFIQGGLSENAKKLDKRFVKCSRSYIINLERVLRLDTKQNMIEFENGKRLYEISRNKKKEILDYLRRVE